MADVFRSASILVTLGFDGLFLFHFCGVRLLIGASGCVQQRRRVEAAFAAQPDCIVVATSTLEIGLDVAALDRVVQN